MSNQDDLAFIPSKSSLFWFELRALFPMLLFLIFLEVMFIPNWSIYRRTIAGIIYFVVFVTGILVTIHHEQKNNVINLSISGITGLKSLISNERTFIEYSKIDVIKSQKRNLLQRLLRYQYIYSIDGDKLLLNNNLFTEEQLKIILLRSKLI
jgi:hypothetical protein